jgi:uncharacterized protein (DUF2141 family)
MSSFVLKEPPTSTYTISIKVTNIRNTKGTMQFQVYRTQKAFAAETPYKTYRISKKSVKDKTLRYKISGLVAGNYGIALLDDENSNKEMDYGWLMPEEGFGFSDYYHTGLSKPTFYKFKFYLKSDKSVVMKVRYM